MKYLLIAALLISCLTLHASEPLCNGDKQKIDFMITPLASWSLIRLGINRKEIERRGHATAHIPVMQALSYLFAENGQRANMQKIKKSHLKWKNLAAGYAERLEEEHKEGCLLEQIDTLAKTLNVNPAILHECVQNGDFVAFFNVL